VVISDDGTAVSVDGARVEDFTVHWRGPLAFARWRDGQGGVHRLAWWPDTLPASARRELRLAAPAQSNASGAHSMAT
jgi:toxin CptA